MGDNTTRAAPNGSTGQSVQRRHNPRGLHGAGRRTRCTGGRMTKKWYNYFVSVDEEQGPASASPSSSRPVKAAAPASSAAQTVAEIAKTVAHQPQFTVPASNSASF